LKKCIGDRLIVHEGGGQDVADAGADGGGGAYNQVGGIDFQIVKGCVNAAQNRAHTQ
jgi:hypothetical protein